jgi:hypothetical protein
VTNDPALADGGDAPVLDEGCMVDAGARMFADVHGAAADDRAAACASAEFRQSHLYRHHTASQFSCRVV